MILWFWLNHNKVFKILDSKAHFYSYYNHFEPSLQSYYTPYSKVASPFLPPPPNLPSYHFNKCYSFIILPNGANLGIPKT